MQNVSGKVAFITGGASGMGLAMARSFSAAGMKVAIADIQQDALDAVAAEFARTNAEVITLKVDVTDRDAMERAARRTEAAFEKIHVVCNNAGVAVGGALDAMSYKDWDWVMGVNLAGVINGVQTFVNRIKAHGEGGHIVNTASMAGQMAIPGLGVYNTTKYAVVGLSETLHADLAVHNIGVSVLCPGVVTTNIFDSGRNRPQDLKGDTDTAALVLSADVTDQERTARFAQIMASALDPSVVGDMVLAAIQANDLYIFSHPELKPMVDARSSAINESFARWARYRKDHGI
jgi:NADP-dependent 3-hydroxy acid dehydrogenase YdfG